jgi:fucose 4-O-acetylase-like acetyltransferase
MLTGFNSQKFRFWSFVSMFLLVYVHGYNLNISYLQPWTLTGEPLTLTGFTEYWLANGIFRFRIPMLFIISGYLFAMRDNRPFKDRVVKRVKTLLYPYLLWSAFGLLLTYALESFPGGRDIVSKSHLAQIDDTRTLLHQYHGYEILARWIFFPVSYQLWFIRVLLVYNLSYPFLRWCVIHPIVKRIFFSFALLFWLSTTGLVLVEGEGLLFFSLGIWMQKSKFNIDVPNKWLNPGFWLPVFIAGSVLKTLIAFSHPFNGIGPVLLLLHKLVVFSGLVCAWFGCNQLVKGFMNRRWFVWLSAFSFLIYVLHAPVVVYATRTLFGLLHDVYGYRLLIFMVLPLCLVAGAVLFGAVLRKLSPRVYGFVTGDRGLA